MDSINNIDFAPLRTVNVPKMRVHRQRMRFALRIVLYIVLTWLALALLWAFLPSPNPERADGNGVDYPTTQRERFFLARLSPEYIARRNPEDGVPITAVRASRWIINLIPIISLSAWAKTIFYLYFRKHKRAMIEKEVLSLRHEIQKGVLSSGQRPEIQDVERTSEFLEKVESYSYLDTSVIKRTKIDKVLKVISKLPDRASLDDLIIQKRATTLLKEWNIRLPYPQHAGIIARLDDKDGANLPWFGFADAVLLYWWIHKDVVTIPITAKIRKWSQGENDFRNLSLYYIVESPIPGRLKSSSPSWTYQFRVIIIRIIAPTAVLVNEISNKVLGVTIQAILTIATAVLRILPFVFLTLAFIFSLWGCLGGPSFEDITQRLQDRLATLDQNRRLKFLNFGWLHDCLDSIYRNERFRTALDICRHGWHPEIVKNRAAEDEEADIMEEAEHDEPESIDTFKP
ncbi:hypothetical protein HYFRA_00011454 [Hymenoscyphus fraxineus]|uniref:Uncharacterized protein n=1 Tax=Hymenoscyphus fraxineus TaxID=746836 RepID=A0A9N9PW72_9HELO|nr:hypothetical protein HYFRA_00011454 [Hymenoscyphus fraxineus]